MHQKWREVLSKHWKLTEGATATREVLPPQKLTKSAATTLEVLLPNWKCRCRTVRVAA